jgi:hypothetical protein
MTGEGGLCASSFLLHIDVLCFRDLFLSCIFVHLCIQTPSHSAITLDSSFPSRFHARLYICIYLFLRFRIARLLTCMFLRLSIVLIHFHGTNVIFYLFILDLSDHTVASESRTVVQTLSDEASLSRADPRAMKMILSECFSSVRLLSPFVADHETRHQMSLLFRWQYFCQFVSIGAGAVFDIILPSPGVFSHLGGLDASALFLSSIAFRIDTY